MKRWTIYQNGTCFGTMAATIQEVEEQFGREGKHWYRRHTPLGELLILRQR